ncbi:hypothetical protein [Sporosarcina sp. OR05]|uniref:hypothetical protein n=1 Tax=Sporosarcina sp. OR05 TaxID=2969819 RepID=UPI00352A88DE
MDSVRNERGTVLAAALLLLVAVSLFLFTLVSWHSNIYRTFDSIEIYYDKQATETIKLGR